MAIAGLQSIPVLNSSYHRVSQTSRQQREEGRPRSRTSAILQMWRDLEDGNELSHNEERKERLQQQTVGILNHELSCSSQLESQGNEGMGGLEQMSESEYECGAWYGSRIGSQNGNEDNFNHGSESERSFGIAEVERERAKQNFPGLMNSRGRGHVSTDHQMSNSSRLWQNESERVRIIREWVQMNTQQSGSCSESTENQPTENQPTEIGIEIERVCDGLVDNQNEGRTSHISRRIRRICGRQALLDMVVKTQEERQRELQGLLEFRSVSQFPHRNRIQSLLKGRFLRKERLVEDKRPSFNAVGELGLLRQRHTVSGLREGFLSRLDNSVHGEVSCNQNGASSNSDNNSYGNVEARGNSSQVNSVDICELDHANKESGIDGSLDHVEVVVVEDMNGQELSGDEEGRRNLVLGYAGRFHLVDCLGYAGNAGESTSFELAEEVPFNERGECSHLCETLVNFHECSELSSEESDFQWLSVTIEDPEVNISEDANMQESVDQVELYEQATQHEEIGPQQYAAAAITDCSDGGWDETNEEWLQDIMNEESGQFPLQPNMNEVYHEHGSLGADENLLDEPDNREAEPVIQVNTSYSFDDDNVYSVELRDLSTRRRVSNLLQSGFRESLEQLIQSYAERQANAPIELEMDNESLYPGSVEQYQGQQTADQSDDLSNANNAPAVRYPQVPQPPWDQVLGQNWSGNSMRPQIGIDWDIINDMRIDMTRLQHRMNNMQTILEACMEMQLELQRSIKQELSAALNQSGVTQDSGYCFSNDKAKWDSVRKGICCICGGSSIDSLLYRCGHMCTCSNCANKLVLGRGKCPMCRAPVVEVIRAYSIL